MAAASEGDGQAAFLLRRHSGVPRLVISLSDCSFSTGVLQEPSVPREEVEEPLDFSEEDRELGVRVAWAAADNIERDAVARRFVARCANVVCVPGNLGLNSPFHRDAGVNKERPRALTCQELRDRLASPRPRQQTNPLFPVDPPWHRSWDMIDAFRICLVRPPEDPEEDTSSESPSLPRVCLAATATLRNPAGESARQHATLPVFTLRPLFDALFYQGLRRGPDEQPAVLILPTALCRQDVGRCLEIVVCERWAAVRGSTSAQFACLAAGRSTALIIEVGESLSLVVPVVDGRVARSACRAVLVGRHDVLAQLAEQSGEITFAQPQHRRGDTLDRLFKCLAIFSCAAVARGAGDTDTAETTVRARVAAMVGGKLDPGQSDPQVWDPRQVVESAECLFRPVEFHPDEGERRWRVPMTTCEHGGEEGVPLSPTLARAVVDAITACAVTPGVADELIRGSIATGECANLPGFRERLAADVAAASGGSISASDLVLLVETSDSTRLCVDEGALPLAGACALAQDMAEPGFVGMFDTYEGLLGVELPPVQFPEGANAEEMLAAAFDPPIDDFAPIANQSMVKAARKR
jgi:Actin